MSDVLRVGLIGAGANTRLRHIPGFRAIGDVEIVAVCNRTAESSQAVADAFGIPAIAPSWKDIVADPDIDAVCIGTWPYLHAEASIAALRVGKHVLCEARMAMNLDEAQQMLEAARAHPQYVAQIVPAPFSLHYDEVIIEMLGRGSLGQLREVAMTHLGGQFADAGAPMTWRQDVRKSGINVMTLGIFYETVARWLDVEPEIVMASAAIHTPERTDADGGGRRVVRIPESLSVVGSYADGMRIIGHFSGVCSGPPVMEIRLHGSRGSLRLDMLRDALSFAPVGREEETPVEVPEEKRIGWRVEEDFVQSIRDEVPVMLTSFEDGVRYMSFTQAVHDSWNAGGAPVVMR